MHEAEYWQKLKDGRVRCELCPNECLLKDGKSGLCKVRVYENGSLKSLGYGLISSTHIDPIEKKPLYHFHPATNIFSTGGWGCSFACNYCQNWTISQQVMLKSQRCSPAELVKQAVAAGSSGIAYTYNEPLVLYEFVRDCACLAHEAGLFNVLVTNGYIKRDPAVELLPLIDALNIDLKSINDEFYVKQCRGRLGPVKDFIIQTRDAGCHFELTNLLIPTLNDSEKDILSLAEWIRDAVGEQTPLHLSAYYPQYKLTVPATPLSTLERAYQICSQYLLYVYLGNVGFSEMGRNTLCPKCGTVLIERVGYSTQVVGIRDGACITCRRKTEVVT